MMINSKKLFGMLFVGLAMMIANPNLGWAEEAYGKGDAYDKSKDEFVQTMEGSGLTVEKVTGSEGYSVTVQTSTLGTYATHENSTVQKMAREYADKKAGYHEPGKEYSKEWLAAKEEGLVIASREYTINMKTNIAAQIKKCEELTGHKCSYASTTFDGRERLRIDDGFLGGFRDLENSSDYAHLLSQIEKAGKLAREEFDKSEEAKNPYIGVSKITLKDSTGKTYTVEVKDGRPEDVLYKVGSFVGCEVLPVKLYKQRKCFFCPLFAVIYRAADNMAVISFEKLAASFAAIIALGLAIYIAFQTLTHVSSLTKQDAPKFLGTLMRQVFKFLIAFFLLMYSSQIYHRIVNPILEGGLAFGQATLTQASACDVGEVMKTKLYEPNLYAKLECFITNVQKEIAFMQSIGTSLMCIGGNAMMFRGSDLDFGDGFWMMLQGAVLGCFGFLLSLAFAFYLIDAVVQLGIVGALMPFLIASWPFKMTSKYASTGFNMVLNSFFVFVFIGLVVSVNFQLIDAALKSGIQDAEKKATYTIKEDDKKETEENVNMGGLQGLYEAINNQKEDEIKRLTDISGMGFIILLICCIFGFKFCGQASSLAEKMAGGGLKGIGSSIGTMAASAAVSGAKKVTKPVRNAVSDRVDSAVRAAPGAILGAPAALYKKFSGKGGADTPKSKPSTPTPSQSEPTTSTPETGSERKTVAENKQGNESTKKGNPQATTIARSEPLSKAELKNEFAQSGLSKENDAKIKQSATKESEARKNQSEKSQMAAEKKTKLASMSDLNSPEAKALAKDISKDEKEAKKYGREANKEAKDAKQAQKQNNVMEKAYNKSRKEGCTPEKARSIATEVANAFNKKEAERANSKQRYNKK